MYNIEFYETIDGISDLWEFLDDLQQKALTNKILERKRRRHHEEKSIKQKLSEMTG